jgi:hypothetical protein
VKQSSRHPNVMAKRSSREQRLLTRAEFSTQRRKVRKENALGAKQSYRDLTDQVEPKNS